MVTKVACWKRLLSKGCCWDHSQAVCPLEIGIWQQVKMVALSASSVKKSFIFSLYQSFYILCIAVLAIILWPTLAGCVRESICILVWTLLQVFLDFGVCSWSTYNWYGDPKHIK